MLGLGAEPASLGAQLELHRDQQEEKPQDYGLHDHDVLVPGILLERGSPSSFKKTGPAEGATTDKK